MATFPACRISAAAPSGRASKEFFFRLTCRRSCVETRRRKKQCLPSSTPGTYLPDRGRSRSRRARGRRLLPGTRLGPSSGISRLNCRRRRARTVRVDSIREQEIQLRPQPRGFHFKLQRLQAQIDFAAAGHQQVRQARLAAAKSRLSGASSLAGQGNDLGLVARNALPIALPCAHHGANLGNVRTQKVVALRLELLNQCQARSQFTVLAPLLIPLQWNV